MIWNDSNKLMFSKQFLHVQGDSAAPAYDSSDEGAQVEPAVDN